MTNWVLLNIPLAIVFLAAVIGIPLWLVLREDDEPVPAAAQAPAEPRAPQRTLEHAA